MTYTITRKSLLYRSGLGFYCVNHVQGCGHGCRYPCYAYQMACRHGRAKDYQDWCRPKVVGNAVELLTRELSRMRKRPDSVHLCLTTDPFMKGYPEIRKLSLKIIEVINSYDIPCSILTKGILPVELADQKVFHGANRYGISLISVNERFRMRWEPWAAPYDARIGALKYLHDQGCLTQVHMEPYPTPNLIEQDLEDILQRVAFMDSIYFGGWNYNPVTGKFPGRKEFYDRQAEILRHFCATRGIGCEADT
ncbi:MAG: radical SAM protein [Chitinivibrionia bacterium]|nr:radical SAM protein [Chitinivibrionia bacterium]